MTIDIQKIRNDFPVLSETVYDGKPLIYLDNAATTQRPSQVEEVVASCYSRGSGNIHRAAHYLADKCTAAYEQTRDTIRDFLNASKREEIIMTKGTTDSINMVAFSFGERFVNQGDEVIVSEMEHHSNIVPWQMMCERRGATLKVLPIDEKGQLKLEELDNLINDKTRIISLTYISNVLGTVNPIKEIIKKAHQHNVPVMVDAAQAVQHLKVDVQELDVDFLAFSGHKAYGTTGTGALYGKEKWLNEMVPYQGGGEMIDYVTFDKTTFNVLPYKFEAGTPNIIGVIGLGRAISYIQEIGLDNIYQYELDLLNYLEEQLRKIDGIRIIGEAKHKASVVSFIHNKAHHYDLGMLLDKLGVAIRTGRHCADPIADHFGIDGTVRASVAFYNTKEEIDQFIKALQRVVGMF